MVSVSDTPFLLEMRGIGKRFGATVALDGVALQVRAGEIHAVLGENGAGKSTLMKILAGAFPPDSGTLRIDGQPFAPRGPMDARQAGIAMIYQELTLAPHLSVEDNIALGVEPHRWGCLRLRAVRQRARAALAALGHADLAPQALVRDLPPALRQVVEIARAFAAGCRVLVLDEPTSSLARDDVARLFAALARLKREGCAVVYISHFLEEAQAVADRYTVLRDGRCVGEGRMAGTSIDTLVRLMIGASLRSLYPRSTRARGEIVLEVSALAGKIKPDFAGLTLHRGEVVGIAGLVGAGRTELLRVLFGLDPLRHGRIRIGIYEGAARPPQRWRQGVGFVSEDRKGEGLAQAQSLADNLTLSNLRTLGRCGCIRPARQTAAARLWIDRLQIRCRNPRQRIADLSGGNQQKVALARLLFHDVDILLLDEPTRGIDIASKAQFYGLIDALAAGDPAQHRPAKAVLLVSSYPPELIGLCDRIAVMHRGRLGPARPAAELTEHTLMLEATGGG